MHNKLQKIAFIGCFTILGALTGCQNAETQYDIVNVAKEYSKESQKKYGDTIAVSDVLQSPEKYLNKKIAVEGVLSGNVHIDEDNLDEKGRARVPLFNAMKTRKINLMLKTFEIGDDVPSIAYGTLQEDGFEYKLIVDYYLMEKGDVE